jgi:predicted RNA-binding Zn-ribbon protein involved in translation (DUF1610 family)
MKTHTCHHPSGEIFVLHQAQSGLYLCPVCGREEFSRPPYSEDGSPSFEMCTCGFEFGFDDSPLASAEAVEGIEANWKRFRRPLIDSAATNSTALAKLEQSLRRIGRRLAFDLIDVPLETNGEQGGGGNSAALRASPETFA